MFSSENKDISCALIDSLFSNRAHHSILPNTNVQFLYCVKVPMFYKPISYHAKVTDRPIS